MYQQYFGLKEAPFSIAPNPRYLYMSERHREALAHLIYGLNSDGAFILLTGDVGTGKTTVSRCLLEQLDDNIHLALILNPRLSVEELLASVCDELGIVYPDKNGSVKIFVDAINRYLLDAHARACKVVILIDEAQNLPRDVLEQLRLLTNLETNERKLLQIILLGQPELQEILSQPQLSQLAQRITARYHLKPLTHKEVQAYIYHRLHVAGAAQPLFSRAAIRQVAELTRGVPRLINVLCDRALLGAYVQNRAQVDVATIRQAAREVLPASGQVSGRKSVSLLVLFALVSLLLLAAILWREPFSLASLVAEKPLPKLVDDKKTIQQKGGDSLPEKNISAENSQQFDVIKWPDETLRLRSNIMAFQSLLALWGLNYRADENGSPCFYAQSQGLACLHDQANLEGLRDYNRPAILKLLDDKGRSVYALLEKIQSDVAFLKMAGKEYRLSIDELQEYWYGDFTLLWKRPPFYSSAIRPGYEGEEVVWLSQILNKLDPDNVTPALRKYTPALLKKVRRFQQHQGLVADGVVGVRTLIYLNHAMGIKAPHLEASH